MISIVASRRDDFYHNAWVLWVSSLKKVFISIVASTRDDLYNISQEGMIFITMLGYVASGRDDLHYNAWLCSLKKG